jgi:hypothetical protein
MQFFRTVLPKKMFSQSSGSSSKKKFLDIKAFENRCERDDDDSGSNQHKWVKTDSECKIS